jgi:type VI secretion system VasD/TssJ family lipoprotein
MKKVVVALLVLTASSLVVSCAAKQPPVMPKVEFGYEKGAVLLHLKADPQLNLYQGSPHTLSLCIYQLRDPNGFNQLASDQNGLYKLLECSRFDGTVAMATRLDVQPGQESSQVLDRAEGAEYVGVAGGYFALNKDRILRLFTVPIVDQKIGWFFPDIVKKPGVLKLDLLLGPQEIQDVGGKK